MMLHIDENLRTPLKEVSRKLALLENASEEMMQIINLSNEVANCLIKLYAKLLLNMQKEVLIKYNENV